MAGLNTLRTKGGWFLTIVIMLALLAFILGDLGGPGRNQNPVVGTIDGEKVHYMDFVNERVRQEEMLQGSGEQAQEEAYQRAWSELVSKATLIPGFHKMGLGLSQAERSDMVSGIGGGYLSPVLEQYFRNPQTGAFDPQALAYFVSNMTPQDHAAWQMILEQADSERLFSKYAALVAGGLYINNLEADKAAEEGNTTYDARLVFKPYSSIADSTVNVSESEIKAYYNSHKEAYKREESRNLEYVVFDVIPSEADMKQGSERANELAAQFAEAGDPATFAQLNSDDKAPATFVSEASLDPAMASAIAAGTMYGPVLDGETYTMARLAERRMLPDSVTFGAIILSANKAALADSLMGVVNKSNFRELALQHSEDRQSPMAGGEAVTLDPLGMTPELMEVLVGTPAGRMAKAVSGGYIFIVDVVGKTAPVAKAKVATLKYAVHASAATHAEATAKARDFYAAATAKGSDFDKAANEAGISVRLARVANTDREIQGLESSLPMVRWAFDSKKGAVMEPEELTRDYIVVSSLMDINEAGITPLEDVKTQIRSLLVQRRKGDMLAETMTGASLDAVAQAQGLEVVEAPGVQFSAFAVPGAGFEPRLVGAICATKETGKLSKPVKGNTGVYAFEVTNIATTDNGDAAAARVRLLSAQQYMMINSLMNALFEKSNVVDQRVKYF
jgi:peptidyl-prolyl cis-trans isomerase D